MEECVNTSFGALHRPWQDATFQPCCILCARRGRWGLHGAAVLLRRCDEAGFDRSLFLADGVALLDSYRTTFALATDDLMIFSVAPTTDKNPSRLQRKAFDEIIGKHGLIPATEKDINDKACATCIGIDIDDGYYLAPHAPKAAMLVTAVAFLASTCARLSDLEVAALLGQCTWFGVMNRPSLSAFDAIYETTTRNGNERATLDNAVVIELAHFACLLPLLEADLKRRWQNCIAAPDASVEYGFGVSIADVSESVSKRLAKVAAHNNHFVRLSRGVGHPDDEEERPRTGVGHNLGLSKWDFRSVISSKRRFDGHSGALEAHGVLLGLRWLLRSVTRHSRRTTILIDAQAVLGAVRKGRSSAPSLKREIAHIGALVLSGDLLLRCLYVPSEDNPADAPSRGIVRKHVFTKRSHRQVRGRKEDAGASIERHLKRFYDRIAHLGKDHPLASLRELEEGN